MEAILQKVTISFDNEIEKAKVYYSIICSANNINITPKELELISFISIKGNINYGIYKKEFCEKYKTSIASINNMISSLIKKKLLVKINSKTKLNPSISLDFKKDINLLIKIKTNLNGQDSK
jgi:DNA-binding MarR family transcriptional regulator